MKYRSAFETEYTKREQLVNVSGSGIQSVMMELTEDSDIQIIKTHKN